jgi:hypothetical protein
MMILKVHVPGAPSYEIGDEIWQESLADAIRTEAEIIAADAGADLLESPDPAHRVALRDRLIAEMVAALVHIGDQYRSPDDVLYSLTDGPALDQSAREVRLTPVNSPAPAPIVKEVVRFEDLPLGSLCQGDAPIQRCIRHKERNVLGHLPERDRPAVKARLRKAWAQTDHPRALEQLKRLASELDHTHPGAAGSLREGLQETLTVIGLGIKGKLKRTLESTNPAESMIDTVRTTQRNVKYWSSGEMGLRWTAAGLLEAEKQFRKVIGYKDLAKLAVAIERDLTTRRRSALTDTPIEEERIAALV